MNKVELLDLKKFPYLEQKKQAIENRKELVDLLNKRKMLIESEWDKLSEFEANERKILLLKTEVELGATHKQLFELQNYLDQRTMQVTELFKEIEEKWDYIMARAETLRLKNVELDTFMTKADTSVFENNLEEKMTYYINVRSAVNPSKNAMKTV